MSSLIGSFFQGSQPPATASSPSPTASASPTARKEELAAQAKGYELVLQREPENQTALRGLLEARLGLGDVKGAITPLEKLAKLNPKETYYSVLLAQAKQQLGDREGAAQTYRSILAAQPGDMLALQGLVGLLVEQKRPEAAIGLLQDTLKTATQANQVQPNSVDVASVQVLLGGVYASQKRYDEAIAIYDEAAKTSKQDFRPIYGKAVLFKEQGKTEEAKPLFTKAAELAPAKYKDLINQVSSSAAPGSTAPATVPGVSPSQTAPVPGQPAPVTSP
ncbi:MAG: tetratricopeptide repeat protein [Leptolyngbyaceae cyanobacterium RU_5_1]|nr:tetratricopeptide repeat protein [Leptolyngbyaceae cyanobacterium RU_5_1]